MTHPHHRFLDRLQGSAQAGQDNIRFGILDIHHPVFPISVAVIAAFVIFALLQAGPTEAALNGIRGWLTSTFDWLFMGAANLFVLFSLFLIFSPMGSVVIGGQDAKPEYSFVGWTSMLFATGMGIGLVFFGVMEPMHHFNNPPLGLAPPLDAQGQLVAPAVAPARELAMAATVFHWGLHPWAIYAVVGLSLALITYNLRLPLSIRSVLYPILGLRHARGALGDAIDILAVFAVLFGLATSLGLGAQQALAGLHHLYGIEINAQNKIILVIVISAIALGSVVAGIEAGVKRLSELNVALALLLMLLIIAVGPTADILQGLLDNTAAYLRYLPQLSQPFGRDDNAFLQGWTSFYWAWWISWSPFVGMFIARISKGRSVRQFLVCVLIAPTLVSIFWMTTFGGTALHQLVAQGYTGVQEMVLANQPELSLFMMLRQLPWAGLTSLVAIVLVVIFFVTSSDSGSLVIDGITAGGKVDAPIIQRIFWALAQGVVALILLLGGGLNSLQAASVATGFPFLFVLLLMMLSTWRVLRWCHRAERRAVSPSPR